MNQIFGLKHFNDRDHNRNIIFLKGRIHGTTVSYFKIIEKFTNTYELVVEDAHPTHPRQWYIIAEGTYDYCLGVLHGRYDHSDKSVNRITITIEPLQGIDKKREAERNAKRKM